MKQQLGWCSLEQSKKLIEAGLEPDTADMHHIEVNNGFEEYYDTSLCYSKCDAKHIKGYLPCWSLGRLIELMPEIAMLVRDSTGNIPSYFISIGPSESGEDIFLSEQYSTPIEAAVYTIIWLLENNYIKKGETK